jgi:hypothetical protein
MCDGGQESKEEKREPMVAKSVMQSQTCKQVD